MCVGGRLGRERLGIISDHDSGHELRDKGEFRSAIGRAHKRAVARCRQLDDVEHAFCARMEGRLPFHTDPNATAAHTRGSKPFFEHGLRW